MTDPRTRLDAALSDRYQIERELGQGGMATVYLARDLRHERRVAVKVLRPELAAVIGAERFLQEIKTTANLQHAHILPLHDSGVADSLLFYVMPFVEGESLRDLLNREKQLEIAQAVDLTRQVASALDYAHRHGVIHRDIKPENVLIHDGQALVADFGIALAVSSAGGATRMTETGMSLGTPQYMSPEQAMGDRELNARSDIYSLGAMLYEMLAGDPPYTGSTAQAIVAKVITEKAAPVTALRETVPPHVAAAVQVALAKIPADRFHSAADFAEALTNPGFVKALPTAAVLAASAASATWKRWIWPAAAAAFAGLALWVLLRPGSAPPSPVGRYGLLFPNGQTPANHSWATFGLAADGSWLAYVGPLAAPGQGQEQLWLKRRDRFESAPLAGTVDSWSPTASPDGLWIAYLGSAPTAQLRKVPVTGGSPIRLADSIQTSDISTADWGDDDVITFVDRRWRLRRVPGGGGTPSVAWTPPAARFAGLPSALPKGRGVLFTLCDQGCRTQEVWVLDLRTSQAKALIPGAARAWYLPTGHLLYVRRDGAAFAVAFDLGTLSSKGAAIPVLDGVQVPTGVVPQLAVAFGGTLAYFSGPGGGPGLGEAVWVTRDGKATPVDSSWRLDVSGNSGWSLSPDGKRLAIKLNTEEGQHIWIKQLDQGPLSRLTFDSAANIRPRWLPDGNTVSYVSSRGGAPQSLYIRRGDGTGPEELKLRMDRPVWEAVWSRDAKWLVLRTGGVAGATGDRDVFTMQLGVDSVPRPLLVTSADEKAIALSPDGRWLAYESTETGRDEVYVRPFPNVDAGKWQVSINGGTMPLWGHRGTELFYMDVATQTLTAARIQAAPSFAVAERRPLFRLGAEWLLSSNYSPFDVSPDDHRFLLVRSRQSAQSGQAAPLILVENWLAELRFKLAK